MAIAAKSTGVVLARGARGVLGGEVVTTIDHVSGALAYTLMALLVALVFGASFELARAGRVNALARGSVVAGAGLTVAFASPAVVERLNILPSLALAVAASLVALVSGVIVLRSPRTRAVGGVLTLLAICGLLHVVVWETSAVSFERASHSLHTVARGLTTAAVTLHALATLLAAAWIGTRARLRGGGLANLAILLAFVMTWLATRSSASPSTIEAMLRMSFPSIAGLLSPYLLGPIAIFLVPASILLAGASLLQRAEPLIAAPLALALLSHGTFDVPLQAMLVTAASQWAILAAQYTQRPKRSGVQQPMS